MEAAQLLQGRLVSAEEIHWLGEWIDANPQWSRKAIARALCTQWEWRDGKGRLKDFAARRLLLKLAEQGRLRLPALRSRRAGSSWCQHRPVGEELDWQEPAPWAGPLEQLRPLSFELIAARSAGYRSWNFYLNRYHYLGLRIVGENVGYLVRDRMGREVACLLFGAAAWRCAPRDQFLGWSSAERAQRLPEVANNTRFLILPWIRSPLLASHILGTAVRRLAADWRTKYHHGLRWLETFVERDRFQGTCYRAANWQLVGQTTGRSRQDRYKQLRVPVKDVYVYPLPGREPMSRLSEALADNHRLRQENARLEKELRVQQQQVAALSEQNRKLQRQVWGKQSERSGAKQKTPAEPGRRPPTKTSDQHHSPVRHGPKPFDPALPRVKIKLPDPAPKDLICPVTGELMRPSFTEMIEVMELIPAAVVIRQLERTWFVSSAKSAPVATPWPDEVFARARVHASVFGHLAAEHYCEHAPFARLEKKWARSGLRLPRATQVSLMTQLEKIVRPVVTALKDRLMQKDYLHLDATPLRLCDPARPGGTVEATIWGYRAKDEPLCWYQFEYERGKSPDHPNRELTAANFHGHLQVDGAAGLSDLGVKGQVIVLGCLSHARRYAFQAVENGDQRAEVYLAGFNKIFKIDRIGRRFRFDEERRSEWRLRYSLPIFDLLVAMAEGEIAEVTPKTQLWDSLHYLIAQQEPLRRCLTTPGAELTNNAAERNLRPLKSGQKNWQWIGHPKAGPRLANLFTLVENCRQLGLNVEAYITDLVTRLPGHPAKKIAELLPAAWKRAQEKLLAAVDPPAA